MTREITDQNGKHRKDETGKYIHSWGVMGSLPISAAKTYGSTSQATSDFEVAQCSMCKKFDLYGGGLGRRLRLTEKQFEGHFEIIPESYGKDPTGAATYRARVKA